MSETTVRYAPGELVSKFQYGTGLGTDPVCSMQMWVEQLRREARARQTAARELERRRERQRAREAKVAAATSSDRGRDREQRARTDGPSIERSDKRRHWCFYLEEPERKIVHEPATAKDLTVADHDLKYPRRLGTKIGNKPSGSTARTESTAASLPSLSGRSRPTHRSQYSARDVPRPCPAPPIPARPEPVPSTAAAAAEAPAPAPAQPAGRPTAQPLVRAASVPSLQNQHLPVAPLVDPFASTLDLCTNQPRIGGYLSAAKASYGRSAPPSRARLYAMQAEQAPIYK